MKYAHVIKAASKDPAQFDVTSKYWYKCHILDLPSDVVGRFIPVNGTLHRLITLKTLRITCKTLHNLCSRYLNVIEGDKILEALPGLYKSKEEPSSHYGLELNEDKSCTLHSFNNFKSLDLSRKSFAPTTISGTWKVTVQPTYLACGALEDLNEKYHRIGYTFPARHSRSVQPFSYHLTGFKLLLKLELLDPDFVCNSSEIDNDDDGLYDELTKRSDENSDEVVGNSGVFSLKDYFSVPTIETTEREPKKGEKYGRPSQKILSEILPPTNSQANVEFFLELQPDQQSPLNWNKAPSRDAFLSDFSRLCADHKREKDEARRLRMPRTACIFGSRSSFVPDYGLPYFGEEEFWRRNSEVCVSLEAPWSWRTVREYTKEILGSVPHDIPKKNLRHILSLVISNLGVKHLDFEIDELKIEIAKTLADCISQWKSGVTVGYLSE